MTTPSHDIPALADAIDPPEEQARMSDYNAPYVVIKNPESGGVTGPDGADHPTERAAFHYGILGLCGCGDPEGAYNFAREVLSAFDRRDKSKKWVNAEIVIEELVAKNPDMAANLLSHLLDTRGVIEHGGNVGGSWLTRKGEQIIDAGPAPEGDFDWETLQP